MLAEHSLYLYTMFTLRSYFRICLSLKNASVYNLFLAFHSSQNIKTLQPTSAKISHARSRQSAWPIGDNRGINEQIHLLVSILRCKCVAIRWRASLYSKCNPSLKRVGFFSTNDVISISILLPKTCDLCKLTNKKRHNRKFTARS